MQLSFVPGVLFDNAGIGHHFGDCILQPPTLVSKGEMVKARFVAGHPRNDLKLDETFLVVEKFVGEEWMPILTDNDWETEFEWIRTKFILGRSEAEVRWFVPVDQESGTYRITHYGHHKHWLLGNIIPYSGTTNEFEVIPDENCFINLLKFKFL